MATIICAGISHASNPANSSKESGVCQSTPTNRDRGLLNRLPGHKTTGDCHSILDTITTPPVRPAPFLPRSFSANICTDFDLCLWPSWVALLLCQHLMFPHVRLSVLWEYLCDCLLLGSSRLSTLGGRSRKLAFTKHKIGRHDESGKQPKHVGCIGTHSYH